MRRMRRRSKEAGECFCTKKSKQILLRRGASAFAELNEKYSKIKRFLIAQSAKISQIIFCACKDIAEANELFCEKGAASGKVKPYYDKKIRRMVLQNLRKNTVKSRSFMRAKRTNRKRLVANKATASAFTSEPSDLA